MSSNLCGVEKSARSLILNSEVASITVARSSSPHADLYLGQNLETIGNQRVGNCVMVSPLS